jgi:apolipoprotein N-acyltransferase
MSVRLPRPSRAAALSLVGGLLVALALPPWGFWPLAFVGIAMFETALGECPTGRQRAARGWLFAAGWLFPGMCWMWFLTAPGYLAAAAMFAGFHAFAAWVAPRGPWRVIGRPAAHTVAEALRFCFPFGGVPLASLAIGQAAGPLISVVRIGGALLLTWMVFQIGFALAGPSPFRSQTARGRGRSQGQWQGVAGFFVALALLPLAAIAPDGRDSDLKSASVRVTVVQGGGPQGTHAIDGGARQVFDRHIAATKTIVAGSTDLVVWPENVIDVPLFEGSEELSEVTAQAQRIGAPMAVGITEDDGPEHFLNAQVIVTPDGAVVSRYDKVRRVPFGEYVPLRGLLEALGAPTNLVPRNAVAGTGPAYLDVPAFNGRPALRVGVVISWEVFFGGRGNDGVSHGGTFILNPTNGSSYTWTVLQSQQIASSRLRAVEQGRWVVQASPTGFSAFISPSGNVFGRTSVSEQRVLSHVIIPSTGRTWYSRMGDKPMVALGALVFAASWHVDGRAWWKRRRRSATDPTPPDDPVTPPTSA